MKNKKIQVTVFVCMAIVAIWAFLLQNPNNENHDNFWASIYSMQTDCDGEVQSFSWSYDPMNLLAWWSVNSFESVAMWFWVNACEEPTNYDFNWHINAGATDTVWTWPDWASDGDLYLYTESSKYSEDTYRITNNSFTTYPVEAILLSPIMDFDDKVIKLTFDYSIYWVSDNNDRISEYWTVFNVAAKKKWDSSDWEDKFTISNTRFEIRADGSIKKWFKWEVKINSNLYDQLQFKVTAGSYFSDIAIDGVKIEIVDNDRPDYASAEQDKGICIFEDESGNSLLSESDLNLIADQINSLTLGTDIVAEVDGINYNILLTKIGDSEEEVAEDRPDWTSCVGWDVTGDWLLNSNDTMIVSFEITDRWWPIVVSSLGTWDDLLKRADVFPLWNSDWLINDDDTALLGQLEDWNYTPLCSDALQVVSDTAPSLDCGFEQWDLCNWVNNNFHSQTWSTRSVNTWPSSAKVWEYYVFLEASINTFDSLWVRADYDTIAEATLTSPSISVLTSPVISFNYNMYWAAIGSLLVEVSDDGANTWTAIKTIEWNKGDWWNNSVITLDDDYQFKNIVIRFTAKSKTGSSSFRGDIAIDNLRVSY